MSVVIKDLEKELKEVSRILADLMEDIKYIEKDKFDVSNSITGLEIIFSKIEKQPFISVSDFMDKIYEAKYLVNSIDMIIDDINDMFMNEELDKLIVPKAFIEFSAEYMSKRKIISSDFEKQLFKISNNIASLWNQIVPEWRMKYGKYALNLDVYMSKVDKFLGEVGVDGKLGLDGLLIKYFLEHE
jgi:hypothetical protein